MDYVNSFVRVFLAELAHASPILVFLVLLICLIGGLIGRIERWTYVDSLYHGFINATTVGYGDLRPTRNISKLLAVVNVFVGIVLVGIIVALDISAAVFAFLEVNELKDELCR